MLPHEILREFRETHGLSMMEMADIVNITLGSWRDLEDDPEELYSIASLSTIFKVLGGLQLTPDELFIGVNRKGAPLNLTSFVKKIRTFLNLEFNGAADQNYSLDWNVYPFINDPYGTLNDYNLEFLIYISDLLDVDWVAVLCDMYNQWRQTNKCM